MCWVCLGGGVMDIRERVTRLVFMGVPNSQFENTALIKTTIQQHLPVILNMSTEYFVLSSTCSVLYDC